MSSGASHEPTMESLKSLLDRSRDIVRGLLELGFERRVRVLHGIGRLLREKLESGELRGLVGELARSTGYSIRNVELDLYFVSEVLNEESLKRLFDHGLVGGHKSVDAPVEVSPGELIWNRPMGTVFIIASGNSVVPPVLATATSVLSGNLTILRPSWANLAAVSKVFGLIAELQSTGPPDAKALGEAVQILYMSHDSPTLNYLLEHAPVSVVNYWGGEPGRSRVLSMAARNPHRPRVVVNGPLTGVAIVDEAHADLETARRLAREVVLYDQQLCSSPTILLFLGSRESLSDFARRLARALDEIGGEFPVELNEGSFYRLLTFRKSLELRGVDLIYSRSAQNPWTLVMRKADDSGQSPTWEGHARRVLEIVHVESLEELRRGLEHVTVRLRRLGVDGIQTVSYSVGKEVLETVLRFLSNHGVYRVVPLGESFLRTPVEPYDGDFIPRYYTYSMYIRLQEKLDIIAQRGVDIP